MKSVALSPALSQAHMLAVELAAAGQHLIRAAALLGGKRLKGIAPVAALVPAGLPAASVTIIDTVNEFLLMKSRCGRSDRYLRQLRVSLGGFAFGRGKLPLSAVTAREIEKWMEGKEWAPRTARGYIADVRTMLNYAVNRGYIDRNPARGVELPLLDAGSAIHVHTPAEVRKVLETARAADLDACRQLAIRYFAGIRSAEMHRLREENIKLDHGVIEVPAAKSKTRSRRLVQIQPNLRAWLDLGGELKPTGDMTLRKVIRFSKVEWHHNVTRHSFCSYHLAQFDNAAKTALQAGHSETMLFKHYRALVLPASAAEFWSIVPAGSQI